MEYFKYCPWDGYRFSETDVQCFICKRPKYTLNNQPQENEKKWEKILYEKQPYDDNYIDETFLQSVVKQDNSNGLDYKQLISKTSDLIFTINSVVIYMLTYFVMLHNILETNYILITTISITFTGLIIYTMLIDKPQEWHSVLSNVKNVGIYVSILLLFAPVMQTVNQTYSDDTIYLLTSGSIIYYLLTKNYDYESVAELETWKADSSNWSSLLFSSLLASRLNNEIEVFIMIGLSQVLFILTQFVKKQIKDKHPRILSMINILLSIYLGLQLLFFSYFLALLYLGLVFFITFVSPLQLIWLYQYKNTIQGPWDLPDVKQYD